MSTSPKLDIVYLLQETQMLWGGVMNVFREAEALQARGHRCLILSPTELGECYRGFDVTFRKVETLTPQAVPKVDLIVATYYPTIPIAWKADRLGLGRACHYCQGYEGDSSDLFDSLPFIERNYSLPGILHLSINDFLAKRCEALFGWKAHVIPYGIGPDFFPAVPPTENNRPVRIGLVGPWEVEWKDLPTGLKGVQQAQERGLEVTLVRMSPIPISEDERKAWGNLQVEAHEELSPENMGVLYRGLDLFVGSSRGGGEGFFLPALEAMASGVPCLLSDIPCFHSYAEPSDYALFFPAGDPNALGEGILRLSRDLEMQRKLRNRGLATARLYSYDRHIQALETALLEVASQPSGVQAQQCRDWDLSEQALLLEERGDPAQALTLLTEALEGHPSSYPLWESLGRILGRMNRLEEASQALARALDLKPSSPSTWGALGFCQSKLGMLDKGIASYQRAIDLGLPGPRPLLDLALIHMGRGDTQKAIQALREAQDKMPRHGPQGEARKRIATEIAYLSALGKPECAC